MELFDLMVEYKNKKVGRLELYVEFNPVEFDEPLKILDINPYVPNEPENDTQVQTEIGQH